MATERVTGDHTYKEFSERPFYIEMNRYTVNKARGASKIVDLASGTGAIITELIEQGKARPPFTILGVDLDFDGLLTIKETFKGSNVFPIRASGEQIPVANNWAELVTACNSIHLMDPKKVFAEAYRVLRPGGMMVLNSAYEKSKGYGDTISKRFLGMAVLEARRALAEKGFTDIPPPIDLMKYTEDDYRKMAENARFANVETEIRLAEMDRDDIEAIFSYREFAEGSLPGVPFKIARDALVARIDPNLERFKTKTVKRNWLIMTAVKPQ